VADFELLLARSPGDEVVQPVTPTAEWLRQAIAWREADLADLRERLALASTPLVRAPDVHHGAPRPEPAAKGPPPLCVWDSE